MDGNSFVCSFASHELTDECVMRTPSIASLIYNPDITLRVPVGRGLLGEGKCACGLLFVEGVDVCGSLSGVEELFLFIFS